MALGRVQRHPDPLETALLLQEILRLRGEASGNPLEGCAWTGDLNGVWRLHRHPAFAPLVHSLLGHAWQYLDGLGFERSRLALHLQRCWPVVSEPGQAVGRHHHPNAHLSAVYYLNGDGSGRCGCLRFFPPVQANELVPGLAVGHGGPLALADAAASGWNAPWFDVAPQAGLLLLFPSRVDHAVLENCDPDDSRFSISLDLALSAPASTGEASPEYLAPHPADWDPVAEPAPAAAAFREDGA
ncbi:MAG: TIGR02466 family protein [Cyanobium sp.]